MRLRFAKSRHSSAGRKRIIILVLNRRPCYPCHQGHLKTFKRLFSAFAAKMLFAAVANGKFAQLIPSVVFFFLVRRVAEGILCHIQAVIALYGLEPSVFGFAGCIRR